MNYVLGVDASLSSTGWAVIDRDTNEVIDAGKICTTNKMNEDDRIYRIAFELLAICNQYSIKESSMEDQFVKLNVKTGLQLSRLRGGIIVALKLTQIPISHYTPSEIKKATTGSGKAEKEEVAIAIQEIYSNSDIVAGLGPFNDRNCKAKNSDIYDAIAIATTHIKST